MFIGNATLWRENRVGEVDHLGLFEVWAAEG